MSAAAGVRPFPWRALDTTTRAEVAGMREARRWLAAHAQPARLESAASELLGAPVAARVQRVRVGAGAGAIPGAAGVLVAPAAAADLAHAVLVEAEPALVAAAVARVTQRRGPAIIDPAVAVSSAAAGAFGAVLVAALRRAQGNAAVRVLAAGPAAALASDVARAGGEVLALSLTVLLGDDAFEARVVVARSAALASASPAWDEASLAGLGAVRLTVPVVAHAVAATAADVAALAPGDALVASGWPLARGGAAGWTGRVRLATPSGRAGVVAQLGDDGRLVLRGELEELVAAAEADMADATDKAALVEALGEVPVVVRVEIGEASMPARDWATLGRGDVIALGRRVGEAVVLRVGGVPVARGDLVDIDGEVGVRIVERLGAQEA